MIACSINERMHKALDYKAQEVVILEQILREVTKRKRIDFTEDQRARLAILGKALTAKQRREHCEIVTPKTIVDWFRRIYADKYDSSKSPGRIGRPRKPKEIRDVVNEGLQIDICRNTLANLTDPIDGFVRDARYLVHDADPLFTDAFKAILEPPGSPRSPNCNPVAERFVKSIKDECLRHFVLFGKRHLPYVIREYMAHYHEQRFHQGIDSKLIRPTSANDNAATGEIKCRSRLGGLLNFYYREAA